VTLAGVGVAFAADWAAVTGRASDLIAGGSSAEQLVYVQLFLGVTLLAAMILATEVAERRRAEHQGRLADAERLRAEAVAAEAADEERRRIARETHDIVGHALNVMLLQAGAARRVMPTDSEQSRELIESLESVGRDAFRDLDVALGITDEPPDALVGRGLSTVPALIGVMRQAGMSVDCVVEGDGRGAVSTLVDWSAFRIIQEAITNVTKHAPRAHTEVRICYEPTALVISVVDDGAGTGPSNGHKNGTGRGIVGMRERVGILGGDIEVGPSNGSGFAVRARIPTMATA
jgi:signal transduction histidine kinase